MDRRREKCGRGPVFGPPRGYTISRAVMDQHDRREAPTGPHDRPPARDASATAKKVAPTHFSRPAPRTPATERCNDAILRVRRIAERPKEAREPRFCAAVPDLRHPYARAAARTARGMRTPRSTRPRRRTAPRMRYCSRAWSAPGATSPPMPVASTPAALGMRATRFDKFGCTAPIKNDRSRAVQAMLV